MKFTISSHINYWEKTYPILVTSLIKSGVPVQDIYFCIGGFPIESKYQMEKYEQINLIKCPHNSVDFTGLVTVLDLNLESDYWFLLHDTCKVESWFYQYVLDNTLDTENIALSKENSMNIGMYKQDYLQRISFEIYQRKNTDYTLEGTNKFKQYLIGNEGRLFNHQKVYNNTKIDVEPTSIYGGTPRITEYYKEIGLYKYKANWKGYKENYILEL